MGALLQFPTRRQDIQSFGFKDIGCDLFAALHAKLNLKDPLFLTCALCMWADENQSDGIAIILVQVADRFFAGSCPKAEFDDMMRHGLEPEDLYCMIEA